MVQDMDSRVTYILTVCFGVSSWVTINGIFSILPLIIHEVPEGWAIASTLGLAIQAANVGPIVYRVTRTGVEAIPLTVYGILALGTLSMLLLACFWTITLEIAGTRCSVALIALTFTAALCDCTSSLVFWPFVGVLAPTMVSGLALGESLSGVVASVVSWLGLSASGSFCALATVLLASGAAFYSLQQRAAHAASRRGAAEAKSLLVERPLASPTLPYVIVGLTSLLENAVLPSVLPYATARHSQTSYHIASTLPVGPLSLMTLAYVQASRTTVAVMAICALLSVAVVAWAGLRSSQLNGDLTIAIVLLAKLLLTYSKGAAMYHIKVGASRFEEATKRLETAGAMMQVWSFSGAVAMFFLTRYTDIFPQRL